MPDADDFDVELFRRLLSGGGERQPPEAPAPARPAKPVAPRTSGKPASRGAKKPKPRRKP